MRFSHPLFALFVPLQAISHGQELVIPVEEQDDVGKDATNDDKQNDWNPPLHHLDDNDNNSLSTVRQEIESILHNLPRNLNIEKEHKKQEAAQSATSQGEALPLEALQEEDNEEEEENKEDDLKIAWQYKKNVQRERPGGVDDSPKRLVEATNDTFCHSFDLQGRLSSQMNVMESCRFVNLGGEELANINPLVYFQRLWNALPSSCDKVTRLLIYEPRTELLRTALPLLLSVIRQKKLPVVVLVVVKSWRLQDPSALTSLQRTADVVLQAQGFAARKVYPPPSEFRIFQGLLRIPKVATVTAATAHGGGHFADLTTTKRAASDLYGLKRDRRKLHIQLLHIPPEEYAESGGSVGGGGVRSGAGRVENKTGLGCASSGGGALDF